jgi:hypothetical protein
MLGMPANAVAGVQSKAAAEMRPGRVAVRTGGPPAREGMAPSDYPTAEPRSSPDRTGAGSGQLTAVQFTSITPGAPVRGDRRDMFGFFDVFDLDIFDALWLLMLIPLFYLGAPLLIRFQQRMNAHPEFETLEFDQLKPSVARFLEKRTDDLLDMGFREPTLVHLPDSMPNVTSYLVMLVNRRTGDKAMVTVILGHGPVPRRTSYVEFNTRFENGEVFNTQNSSELTAFPPGPTTVRTQVPDLRDPQELYELHRFVMDQHGAEGPKELYERGEALDYLQRFAFTKVYKQQVKRGWLYYDEDADCYRPTLLGAYLLTWGLLQPMKAIRKIALRNRAAKVLAEFDEARTS